MRVPLNDIDLLFWHDAAILELKFPSLENGFDIISIRIRINPEESLDPIKKLGVEGSEFWLVFEGCSMITASLIGYCSGREVVSTLDLIEPSEIKERLKTHGIPALGDGSHYKIEGSHGSLLEILAKSVSIEEV